MAPVVQALSLDKDINSICVNTGQHAEMLDQVLDLFELVPDYNLRIMRPGQTVEELTARILTKLTPVLEKENPDLVLVHGDTTTTLIGAYAAFLQKIPVGHVEAGLRTYDQYSPFPEEVNRQLVARMATYHFAATETNKQNLLQEKIAEENIVVTGNTVIDALHQISAKPYFFQEELASVFSQGKRIILLTTHRRENVEELQHVYRAINRLVKENEDVQVVFPVHKNPVIRQKVLEEIENKEKVHVIEPLNYEEFVHVMKKSHIVITDSGGIQEEAPGLGKPVLVVRDTTERPEGVEAGTLKLVGTSEVRIYEECKKLLMDESAYKKMAGISNPFGEGDAARQIVRFIKDKVQADIYIRNEAAKLREIV